jgi:hypothetical protein
MKSCHWKKTELYFAIRKEEMPITVAARSEARNIFARSNTGIVGSNLTTGMDVCPRFFCVRVVLYIGSGLGKR